MQRTQIPLTTWWAALLGAGALLALVLAGERAIQAGFDWLDRRVAAVELYPEVRSGCPAGEMYLESFESDYGFGDDTDYFADFLPWLPVVGQADHRAMAAKADLN